jgi:hypothetical protein
LKVRCAPALGGAALAFAMAGCAQLLSDWSVGSDAGAPYDGTSSGASTGSSSGSYSGSAGAGDSSDTSSGQADASDTSVTEAASAEAATPPPPDVQASPPMPEGGVPEASAQPDGAAPTPEAAPLEASTPPATPSNMCCAVQIIGPGETSCSPGFPNTCSCTGEIKSYPCLGNGWWLYGSRAGTCVELKANFGDQCTLVGTNRPYAEQYCSTGIVMECP